MEANFQLLYAICKYIDIAMTKDFFDLMKTGTAIKYE